MVQKILSPFKRKKKEKQDKSSILNSSQDSSEPCSSGCENSAKPCDRLQNGEVSSSKPMPKKKYKWIRTVMIQGKPKEIIKLTLIPQSVHIQVHEKEEIVLTFIPERRSQSSEKSSSDSVEKIFSNLESPTSNIAASPLVSDSHSESSVTRESCDSPLSSSSISPSSKSQQSTSNDSGKGATPTRKDPSKAEPRPDSPQSKSPSKEDIKPREGQLANTATPMDIKQIKDKTVVQQTEETDSSSSESESSSESSSEASSSESESEEELPQPQPQIKKVDTHDSSSKQAIEVTHALDKTKSQANDIPNSQSKIDDAQPTKISNDPIKKPTENAQPSPIPIVKQATEKPIPSKVYESSEDSSSDSETDSDSESSDGYEPDSEEDNKMQKESVKTSTALDVEKKSTMSSSASNSNTAKSQEGRLEVSEQLKEVSSKPAVQRTTDDCLKKNEVKATKSEEIKKSMSSTKALETNVESSSESDESSSESSSSESSESESEDDSKPDRKQEPPQKEAASPTQLNETLKQENIQSPILTKKPDDSKASVNLKAKVTSERSGTSQRSSKSDSSSSEYSDSESSSDESEEKRINSTPKPLQPGQPNTTQNKPVAPVTKKLFLVPSSSESSDSESSESESSDEDDDVKEVKVKQLATKRAMTQEKPKQDISGESVESLKAEEVGPQIMAPFSDKKKAPCPEQDDKENQEPKAQQSEKAGAKEGNEVISSKPEVPEKKKEGHDRKAETSVPVADVQAKPEKTEQKKINSAIAKALAKRLDPFWDMPEPEPEINLTESKSGPEHGVKPIGQEQSKDLPKSRSDEAVPPRKGDDSTIKTNKKESLDDSCLKTKEAQSAQPPKIAESSESESETSESESSEDDSTEYDSTSSSEESEDEDHVQPNKEIISQVDGERDLESTAVAITSDTKSTIAQPQPASIELPANEMRKSVNSHAKVELNAASIEDKKTPATVISFDDWMEKNAAPCIQELKDHRDNATVSEKDTSYDTSISPTLKVKSEVGIAEVTKAKKLKIDESSSSESESDSSDSEPSDDDDALTKEPLEKGKAIDEAASNKDPTASEEQRNIPAVVDVEGEAHEKNKTIGITADVQSNIDVSAPTKVPVEKGKAADEGAATINDSASTEEQRHIPAGADIEKEVPKENKVIGATACVQSKTEHTESEKKLESNEPVPCRSESETESSESISDESENKETLIQKPPQPAQPSTTMPRPNKDETEEMIEKTKTFEEAKIIEDTEKVERVCVTPPLSYHVPDQERTENLSKDMVLTNKPVALAKPGVEALEEAKTVQDIDKDEQVSFSGPLPYHTSQEEQTDNLLPDTMVLTDKQVCLAKPDVVEERSKLQSPDSVKSSTISSESRSTSSASESSSTSSVEVKVNSVSIKVDDEEAGSGEKTEDLNDEKVTKQQSINSAFKSALSNHLESTEIGVPKSLLFPHIEINVECPSTAESESESSSSEETDSRPDSRASILSDLSEESVDTPGNKQGSTSAVHQQPNEARSEPSFTKKSTRGDEDTEIRDDDLKENKAAAKQTNTYDSTWKTRLQKIASFHPEPKEIETKNETKLFQDLTDNRDSSVVDKTSPSESEFSSSVSVSSMSMDSDTESQYSTSMSEAIRGLHDIDKSFQRPDVETKESKGKAHLQTDKQTKETYSSKRAQQEQPKVEEEKANEKVITRKTSNSSINKKTTLAKRNSANLDECLSETVSDIKRVKVEETKDNRAEKAESPAKVDQENKSMKDDKMTEVNDVGKKPEEIIVKPKIPKAEISESKEPVDLKSKQKPNKDKAEPELLGASLYKSKRAKMDISQSKTKSTQASAILDRMSALRRSSVQSEQKVLLSKDNRAIDITRSKSLQNRGISDIKNKMQKDLEMKSKPFSSEDNEGDSAASAQSKGKGVSDVMLKMCQESRKKASKFSDATNTKEEVKEEEEEEEEPEELVTPCGIPLSRWDGESHRMTLKGKKKYYGTPSRGSKSDLRGIRAGNHVSREVFDLCEWIYMFGHDDPYCIKRISFGHLFHMYTKISDKVVGMLIRARRHGLVEFEGEMLYQRQDEHVVIRLVKLPLRVAVELGLFVQPES